MNYEIGIQTPTTSSADTTTYVMASNSEYLLGVLNSKLFLLRHIILHCYDGCDMQPSWKKKRYLPG